MTKDERRKVKVQIDCYGFPATSEFFKIKELEAHLLKKGPDDELYVCFGEQPRRPIHRIELDSSGGVRIMWAYGRWEDAISLAYVPINETLEVERS